MAVVIIGVAMLANSLGADFLPTLKASGITAVLFIALLLGIYFASFEFSAPLVFCALSICYPAWWGVQNSIAQNTMNGGSRSFGEQLFGNMPSISQRNSFSSQYGEPEIAVFWYNSAYTQWGGEVVLVVLTVYFFIRGSRRY